MKITLVSTPQALALVTALPFESASPLRKFTAAKQYSSRVL
nr:MAG TPA: hypothetical protein [Caudoviricetes sp.]